MASGRGSVGIIGAGIMGLNVALQLAKRGEREVLVLEKGRSLGEGSTGASSAVLRHLYTYDEMVQFAKDGYRAFTSWASYLETPEEQLAGRFTRTCGVWMTHDPASRVRANADRLARFQVPSSVLTMAQVAKRWPALNACTGALAGHEGEGEKGDEEEHRCDGGEEMQVLVEENCGYFEPVDALEDLCAAVRRNGVRVEMGSGVTDILRTSGGRVTGVRTRDGRRVDCGTVVNCAGPWTNEVLRMAGATVPFTLEPTRIQVVYRGMRLSEQQTLGATDRQDAVLPFFVDVRSGIYLRPQLRQRQLIVSTIREEDEREGVPDAELDCFSRSVDPDVREKLRHALEHRLRSGGEGLLESQRKSYGQICGLYTINRQDFHPLIGPIEGCPGFIACNGFSGHGFKIAPAVGSMVAQMLSSKPLSSSSDASAFETTVDPSFFSPNRSPIPLERKGVLA